MTFLNSIARQSLYGLAEVGPVMEKPVSSLQKVFYAYHRIFRAKINPLFQYSPLTASQSVYKPDAAQV